ncbi:MAG TPA: helix-turn-helix domain-containing protein [Kofleriaceae bacterium]|nr:helix-turn-helix domain-containing protein [Kofleriaceae bacterium]
MSKVSKRRTYDASGRQRRALETQERVLDVARRLFAERGYAETTLDAIASEAGVATPTVYAAFQSKRGVLSALLHRLVSGAPGGTPLLQMPGPRAIAAEPDPRRMLAMFVQDVTGVQARVMPMYEVMKHAARTDDEIAELFGKMQQYRYGNLETIPKQLAVLGALREGLTIEDAARTLWVVTSPEARQLLCGQAGWSLEHYQAWLEDVLVQTLLAPAPSSSTAGRNRRTRS